MSFIIYDHIEKTYPGSAQPAVADLNLEIEKGEFLTLLGPSGSGKTTSLMLLAGFEQPTSGAILLDGQHIETLPPYKRDMGVVFQSYSLFPHMTVAQNVAFPLQMRKVAKAEISERVMAVLRKVRLDRYADRKPAQLSGGERQRVAIARALVFDPRLVLMDEPLSALDKNLREEMQLEIRRLHRELGVTMVFVTHDQSEAMTLSDRIAVFNQGRLAQIGAPDRLYDAPANGFVATFIGDNNIAPCRVTATQGDMAQVEIAGQTLSGRTHAGAYAPGAEARLCVRPESVRIGDAGDNHIPADVIDMINQGDHWRFLVAPALPGVNDPWMIKVQPSQLPAGISPGARIDLGFDAEKTWVI